MLFYLIWPLDCISRAVHNAHAKFHNTRRFMILFVILMYSAKTVKIHITKRLLSSKDFLLIKRSTCAFLSRTGVAYVIQLHIYLAHGMFRCRRKSPLECPYWSWKRWKPSEVSSSNRPNTEIFCRNLILRYNKALKNKKHLIYVKAHCTKIQSDAM